MLFVEKLGVSIRKVYNQNGSYVITLPKEWVESFGSEFYKLSLRKGGEIILQPVR